MFDQLLESRTGGTLRRHWKSLGAVFALGWGTAAAVSAGEVEDAIAIAVGKAMGDVELGHCEQAYRELAAINGLDGRARLLAGQCQIRAGLYPEALASLDPARGAKDLDASQIADVELYRGVALYHLERFTEASAALDRAASATTDEAQLALYQGLVALRKGDRERAAPALESAARLSPATTEPVASYYAGLAWQGANERNKARMAFQRVVDLDGNGPWGKEAAKLLESTELLPYFVRGHLGIEYDDNVILRGGVTQFLPPNSNFALNRDGQKDWRGVWRLDAGVQLFAVEDWSGGVIGSYYGNAHYHLQDFNTEYPTVGAYLAYRLGPNTVSQARYQFGFAWVDEDSFLRTNSAELGLSHTWQKAGTTVFVTDVVSNDLRFSATNVLPEGSVAKQPCNSPVGAGCGPIGLNEQIERDRDGIGFGVSVEHRYLVPVPVEIDEIIEEIEIGGGYGFRNYNSRGDEWKHTAHLVRAGIEIELPLDFSVTTAATYEFRDFADPSTFPDHEVVNRVYVLASEDRKEHEVTFTFEVEKDLTPNISLSARWSYLNNESNRRVYDYTRNIVGGYLNFRFD